MNAVLVKVKGFNILRGEEKFFREGFSFEMRSGQVVGVLGLNGSGKSTLMKHLAAHDENVFGFKVCGLAYVDEAEVLQAAKDPKKFAEQIVYFGGGFSVPEQFTVSDLLEMSSQRKKESASVAIASSSALQTMELETLLLRDMETLSEGERQWAMLARLIYQNPKVLILDEAVSKIDFFRLKKLSQVLRLRSETGGLTFLVSHDYRLLFEISQTLIVLAGNKADRKSVV